ncbi:hypothetical protein [Nocardia sp. NBC_00416]|uniref:hypothetical protein n=1 Tax=Nocardia sp. NBC_00416 TaxID=2975991 RepID=UPI002E1CDBFD
MRRPRVVRATVTVTPRGQYWAVAFSEYDDELFTALEAVISREKRQWDRDNREWRIFAGITQLCTELERFGAKVTWTNEHPRQPRETDDDVEHWKMQYEAMAAAAHRLEEEVLRLQDVVADRVPPAPGPGDWAEQLFAAVGEPLVDSVYKALSLCLHPDRPDGDTALMQQLNNARETVRKR